LVEVLGHQNPDARVHAAFALASIGRGASEESVVPALRNALQDNEFKVRYAMSCALKNIQRITACDPESILAPAGWRGR
jgi:HEAT repeat protein